MSLPPKPDRRKSSPYGSARDLPSFQEMAQFIQGGKLLTRVIARDQQSKLLEIEREMDHLAEVVDRFYERLGPRNWIFHDQLNLTAIESLLDETDAAAEAEARLIELYRERKTFELRMMRLRTIDGLRERAHQIDRAWEHYEAEQFDSCVLHLIAVMDGFVNDFEPHVRRGLTARDPDEMAAWDSVVGHHMGLTHALQAFRKTVKKRIDEEVFELHRHGIMHGSITRFNNVVVATKAWNMLFAVADWAAATTKAQEPVEPEPTLRELMGRIRENQEVKKQVDAWKPLTHTLRDEGFSDLEIHRSTAAFFESWRDGNFGALASLASRMSAKGKGRKQIAGEMRDVFDGFELEEFEITEIANSAPALWISRGTALVNGASGTFECRWRPEDESGRPAYGSDSATWRLVFCSPSVWKPRS